MAKKSPVTPITPATSAEARAILDGLRERHAKLESRRDAIAKEREDLAGAALIDGNDEAKKTLAGLSTEAASVAVDVENVLAAINIASARLKDAEEREAHEREIQKAKRAREILAERQALAKQAELALTTFTAAVEQMSLIGRELQKLTDRASGERHLGMIIRAAQQSARCSLVQKGLISSEPMPDERMRHPLPELLAHIDLGARRWADITIDGEAKQEAA